MKTTKLYTFILGSNPALSTAEIFAVLGENINVIGASKEVLLVEAEISENLIDKLGGTIKIIEITSEDSWKSYDPMKVVEEISRDVKERGAKEGKFHLGLSVYNLDSSKTKLFRLSRSLKFFYINIKKLSAKDGIKIAFPRIKERILSSASVLKNGLMNDDGAEFNIILGQERYWLGRTIGIQDIDEYSRRDIERPQRDLLSGTTPPKLAKLMVNLATAGKERDAILLDPFCGSGTFVQEMKLSGFENIYGSDISEKAVSDTTENMEWLLETFHLKGQEKIKIAQADALRLSSVYGSGSIDAVASEVYLGPPLKQLLNAEEGERLVGELSEMYSKFLPELSKVLKKDGRAVLALPIFKTTSGLLYLNIDKAIKDAGLKISTPSDLIKNKFSSLVSKRGSLIYSRPDQLVLREIIAFEKSQV